MCLSISERCDHSNTKFWGFDTPRILMSYRLVNREHCWITPPSHYCDVIMDAIASQITSLTIVYSTVYSGADQRKIQSSASLAFVRRIHRWPVNSPHKWLITQKMFPFDDVIIELITYFGIRTLIPRVETFSEYGQGHECIVQNKYVSFISVHLKHLHYLYQKMIWI